MHRDDLRKILRERPFKPFRVYTPDGTALSVWHPDWAYLSPDGRTLFVYERDYSFNMLDVPLIPRVEFDSPPELPEPSPTSPPLSQA
jgi:hypothetical protein